MATDEMLLHPDPYDTRDKWCEELVKSTIPRLEAAASQGIPLVIINHWPLRQDLITIPSIPRFTLWCGTKATHDWHKRFNAKVVVTGEFPANLGPNKDRSGFRQPHPEHPPVS